LKDTNTRTTWQEQPWAAALIALSKGVGDTSFNGGIDLTELTQSLITHLSTLEEKLDTLAVGNLEAQHRAAEANSKLRAALTSCSSLLQDPYMQSVINKALEV